MEGAKLCIICGMPLRSAEDYPLGDESKDYCKFCAREDGAMKSYEEALEGMTMFLQNTQGLTEEAARQAALATLAKSTAWKDRAK